jgi:hypothetical protein
MKILPLYWSTIMKVYCITMSSKENSNLSAGSALKGKAIHVTGHERP